MPTLEKYGKKREHSSIFLQLGCFSIVVVCGDSSCAIILARLSTAVWWSIRRAVFDSLCYRSSNLGVPIVLLQISISCLGSLFSIDTTHCTSFGLVETGTNSFEILSGKFNVQTQNGLSTGLSTNRKRRCKAIEQR